MTDRFRTHVLVALVTAFVLMIALAGVPGRGLAPAVGQEKYPNRPIDFIVTWGWQFRGIVAKKGTAAERVKVLADAFKQAMDTPKWKQFSAEWYFWPDSSMGPDEFGRWVKAEVDTLDRLVKEAVGTEAQYGVERFTFGVPFLKTGVDFVTVMGVILGPMAEQYFLTSMVAHGNDVTVFVTRPVSAAVLGIAAAMVGWAVLRRWLRAAPDATRLRPAP